MSERELNAALRAMANKRLDGQPLDERLEAAIDHRTKYLIEALAVTMGGNPRMKRSAATRLLIQEGARALLAERSVKA